MRKENTGRLYIRKGVYMKNGNEGPERHAGDLPLAGHAVQKQPKRPEARASHVHMDSAATMVRPLAAPSGRWAPLTFN